MGIVHRFACFAAAIFTIAAVVVAEPPTRPAATRPTTRPTRVLIIAGGTSHDFKRWFEEHDAALLRAAGCMVTVTESPAVAADQLAHADVAVVSTNAAEFDTPAFRSALFAFVAADHGLVLLHPATWYNYDRWPAYNAQLVGGGTRSHDAIAPFTITAVRRDHPVMAGVPSQFDVTDELYHVNPPATRPADPTWIPVPIDVLAQTSPSKRYRVPHPSVWIPRTAHGRVVCIAIGHDGRVHQLEPFKTLLKNAVQWTAGD